MILYEYEYSESISMIAEMQWEDDSFDHAFGLEKTGHWECSDLTVLVVIEDVDYDLTDSFKSINPEEYDKLKTLIAERYTEEVNDG